METGSGAPYNDTAWLELADILADCDECSTTLDSDLNSRVRALLKSHIERGRDYGITHGAVAVVDVHTGELLVLVGSPAPESRLEGMRINMALETRPIGSTIKPFLYVHGFAKGLRPYTLVDDREHKFDIETGFPLYPKNYDGQYRGTVTLEESLANSLNVPAVEVLRFIGLGESYEFLERTLGFKPPQSWEAYAYGIALGGLELDLVTLTHAFTAFARKGELVPLITGYRESGEPYYFLAPHSHLEERVQIAAPEYIALVNTILTDRTAGVEQFGQKGSLHLSRSGYGVKTGTSRDYHDSWTIGYTGDYAVGVWLGNVGNTPMNKVSGATGAGTVWHDVMELLFTTPYYQATPLNMGGVVQVPSERSYVYGLPNDDVAEATTLLQNDDLIMLPHEGDTFLLTEEMRIPLTAAEEAVWTINDTEFGTVEAWYPTKAGTYTLTADTESRHESIEISIVSDVTTLP